MTPGAVDVLRALHAATRAASIPPPAALIGDWADADAVIAPSVDLIPGAGPPDDPDRYWLGYLAFPVNVGSSVLPDQAWGATDTLLVLRDGRWHELGAPAPDWVRSCLRHSNIRPDPWSARWQRPPQAPHLDAVQACLDAIEVGEIYQACVCTRFTGHLDGCPVDFYADLAAATAPARSAFVAGPWGALASFSPETFLRRRGRSVSSSPIKGTVAADVDPAHLAASEKDIAENIMIVDLVRNDLSRVADTGSVRVDALLDVVGAPGVWHLVSRVSATLRLGVGNDALLAATFPPASVTGTPKLRAMELLAGWEPHPRGPYCGAVGIAGPDGLLDLNVAIRTAAIDPDGDVTLGVGGGITIDSDPQREWFECLDKAASIVTYSG